MLPFVFISILFIEIADITHALSKLTEPAPVPIHKLSVSNMVHTAKKKIRKHRGVEESPLNNDVLNTILLVTTCSIFTCLYAYSFVHYMLSPFYVVGTGLGIKND